MCCILPRHFCQFFALLPENIFSLFNPTFSVLPLLHSNHLTSATPSYSFMVTVCTHIWRHMAVYVSVSVSIYVSVSVSVSVFVSVSGSLSVAVSVFASLAVAVSVSIQFCHFLPLLLFLVFEMASSISLLLSFKRRSSDFLSIPIQPPIPFLQ